MAPDQSTQTEATGQSFYAPGNAPAVPQPTMKGPPAQPAQPYATYPLAYGQPIQGYPYAVAAPEPETNKAWEMTKYGLHGCSIVFGIICIGTSVSLIGSWLGLAFVLASCPVAAASVIWSGSEFVTRIVRKWRAGIHPGAHVGVSLLIWLCALLFTGMQAASLRFSDYEDEDDNTRCWDDDINDFTYCRPDRYWNGQRAVAMASTAFVGLLWLTHFVLFVGACVDTAKRNSRARRVMLVPAQPAYWSPEGIAAAAGGVLPFQQQQQQQQPSIPMQTRSPPQTNWAPAGDNGIESTAPTAPQPAVTEYYTPGGR